MAQHRGDLSDAQWQRLQPLLPKPAAPGRPANDHRQILNDILWIHRTGAPWSDLPERYGSRGTVSSRFTVGVPKGCGKPFSTNCNSKEMPSIRSIGKCMVGTTTICSRC
ncbi:transposase [Cyanobacteria bacterium FACHB-63]|nr:transposase [Cyanobacteria bacterium FACHB-63]